MRIFHFLPFSLPLCILVTRQLNACACVTENWKWFELASVVNCNVCMSFHEFFTAREDRKIKKTLSHTQWVRNLPWWKCGKHEAKKKKTQCENAFHRHDANTNKRKRSLYFISTEMYYSKEPNRVVADRCYRFSSLRSSIFFIRNTHSMALLLLIFFFANYLWLEKKCRAQQYGWVRKKLRRRNLPILHNFNQSEATHAENARALLLYLLA